MNPFDVAQSFIEFCGRSDMAAAWRMKGFHKAMEDLGFRYWALCSHVDPLDPPVHAILLHNYPAAWVQYYCQAGLHEIDPVLERAGRDPLPFFWDTAFHRQPIPVPQRKLLADAAEFGLVHGYTVPIHLSWLPGALRASCSVVPGTGSIDPRSYVVVASIANAFYATLNRSHITREDPTPIKLSRRERECLALAAQGKNDRAIGELLNLSAQTVHWHLKLLLRRLNLSTRVQAVLWALENGQLSFGEVLPMSDKDDSPSGTLAP